MRERERANLFDRSRNRPVRSDWRLPARYGRRSRLRLRDRLSLGPLPLVPRTDGGRGEEEEGERDRGEGCEGRRGPFSSRFRNEHHHEYALPCSRNRVQSNGSNTAAFIALARAYARVRAQRADNYNRRQEPAPMMEIANGKARRRLRIAVGHRRARARARAERYKAALRARPRCRQNEPRALLDGGSETASCTLPPRVRCCILMRIILLLRGRPGLEILFRWSGSRWPNSRARRTEREFYPRVSTILANHRVIGARPPPPLPRSLTILSPLIPRSILRKRTRRLA